VPRRALADPEPHRTEEATDERGRTVSPRRRIDAAEADYFAVTPKPPRRWGLAVTAVVATLLIAAAVTASTFMLVRHERAGEIQSRAAAALTYVRGFMTAYTTLDPFHANDYADRILA